MKKTLALLSKECRAGNRKGFTLMEILAVLLIIAVVLSFAIPAFRSVRFEQRNSLAKAGVKKLSEAVRSYYQNSKGVKITGSFTGNSLGTIPACSNWGASGVPGTGQTADIKQLFSCGYLNANDFATLPYTFYSCVQGQASTACNGKPFAVAVATGEGLAGKKYVKSYGGQKYYIFLDDALQVTDNADD